MTVTFTCSDEAVGIASCTSPVTVTTEGAGQAVTGTAVNNDGVESSTTVTINLDKTAPVITGLTLPESVSPEQSGTITVTVEDEHGTDSVDRKSVV